MQSNKWKAFLLDPELTGSREHRSRHNGEYLFGKICHDTLECLNNYLAVLSLIDAHDVKISCNVLTRLSAKKGAIETAASKIHALAEQSRNRLDSNQESPTIIQLMGSHLGEFQLLPKGFPTVDTLVTEVEKDLMTTAMANLRGLQAIYADIRAENYKQLLTTAKYY
ncbi:MAG: hypothetical protein IT327_12320 [Anaerolineae bacterium]|nr:hypothetical protein [Anaerolineae bacterium]